MEIQLTITMHHGAQKTERGVQIEVPESDSSTDAANLCVGLLLRDVGLPTLHHVCAGVDWDHVTIRLNKA